MQLCIIAHLPVRYYFSQVETIYGLKFGFSLDKVSGMS